jgi:hypothetical protein
MMRWNRVWGGGGVVLALSCAAVAAVSGRQTAETPHLGAQGGSIFDSPIEHDPVFQARRLRALNEARQQALVSDTKKLLELTMQLDAEVKAGTEDGLTPEQMVRVAQIEKLAHRVKDKMIESDADVPGMRPLFSPDHR